MRGSRIAVRSSYAFIIKSSLLILTFCSSALPLRRTLSARVFDLCAIGTVPWLARTAHLGKAASPRDFASAVEWATMAAVVLRFGTSSCEHVQLCTPSL